MHQPQQSSNDEHSALAKSQIAQEWQEAKQREINRQLEQAQQNMQYEQNHLLRSSGIDPASGLKDLSARSADGLLACEPEWIKDSLCNECKICNRYFTFTKRKHHCRFCGGVVCNECSQHRALLPLRFALRETARVCIPCHQRLEPVQPMLQRLKALKHRKNTKYNPDVDQYRSQMNFPINHPALPIKRHEGCIREGQGVLPVLGWGTSFLGDSKIIDFILALDPWIRNPFIQQVPWIRSLFSQLAALVLARALLRVNTARKIRLGTCVGHHCHLLAACCLA
jgi:superfamily II helicase